jgi:hypothetical protein
VIVFVLPLFEFHYTRYINNDPLISPSVVVSIQGNLMRLEDGRSVILDTRSGVVNDLVSSLSNRVDLEIAQNGEDVTIFVDEQYAFCGDPFVMVRWLFPPYRIPLFPDDRPLNYRKSVGTGKLVEDAEITADNA